MQRVAIARALVNDPDILLADEPTGALDSDTSIQVMDLLKEVARERLVVMVTHNPELAEQYATRIVNLKDGTIRADSMPYEVNEEAIGTPEHRNLGKSSMSFLTALSLSFNNLKTKKARTLLTSFAGSIGIIGIALILSLSTGVNAYIQSVEEDTLSEYPLEINSTGVDFSSMLMVDGGDESQTGEVGVTEMVTNLFSKMDSNDLSSLKEYLDSGKSGVEEYAKSIEYTYNVSPQIFRTDGDSVRQVNPDRSFSAMGISSDSSNSLMSMSMNTDVFYEMPADSDLYQEQYDVKAGRWPEEYNECVLVLTSGGNISDMMMYTLGLRDAEELDTMVRQFMAEEDVETPSDEGTYSYDDILGTVFKLVNSADYYEYDSEYHVWTDKSGDEAYLKDLVSQGEDLTIVGIVQPSEESDIAMLSTGIGYLPSLTEHVILEASDSEIVKEQLQDRNINVFTGKKFGEQDEEDEFDMTSLFTVDGDAMAEAFQVDESMFQVDLSGLSNLNLDTSAISGAFQIDADSLDLTNLLDFEDLSELTEDLQQDLQNLTKDLDLSMSQEEMQAMTQDLASGFAESLTEEQLEQMNPAGSISDYLQTDEAKQLLSESIRDLILSNMTVSVPEGKLAEIAGSLVVGYQSYAEANDIQETNVGTILAYLQSAEVQQTINSQAEQIIGESVRIDIQPEQLQQVMSALIAGYQNYTAQNSSSDSVSIGQEFLNYLQSEDGQQRIYENIVTSTDIMNLADRISGEVQTQGGDLGEKIQQQISGKIEEAMSQLSQNLETAMQQVAGQIGSSMASAIQQALGQVGSNLENAVSIDEDAFMDAIQVTMDQDELTQLLTSMMSGEDAAYDNNLRMLGYADLDSPSGIAIYPRDFESKEEILAILDDYNARMEAEGQEEKAITYTDMVGTLMSSVTDIIDVISYVLVAFVAISLVVSSIMIGVITYISVLERKKEIGILRAIGASKRNVSQVFNAETFIIGFCAGAMGIGITLLLLIPGNQIIHSIAGRSDINAILPVGYAAVLVALSVLLTLLGGLIPSRKAAKNDPVEALRTE